MQVVIIYESLTGNTEQAARLIADAFYERDVASHIYPVGGIDAEVTAQADLLVVGSWTDGFFVVGQRPAKKKKFTKLPSFSGKKAVVFCTYAVDPGKTLNKLTKVMEGRGAEVLGGLAIRRNDLAQGAVDFVDRVMDVTAASQ
jgi:flavodoxin